MPCRNSSLSTQSAVDAADSNCRSGKHKSPGMRVVVHFLGDGDVHAPLDIPGGKGLQTFKWLALAACRRAKALVRATGYPAPAVRSQNQSFLILIDDIVAGLMLFTGVLHFAGWSFCS